LHAFKFVHAGTQSYSTNKKEKPAVGGLYLLLRLWRDKSRAVLYYLIGISPFDAYAIGGGVSLVHPLEQAVQRVGEEVCLPTIPSGSP
jgi:hypothetical protein